MRTDFDPYLPLSQRTRDLLEGRIDWRRWLRSYRARIEAVNPRVKALVDWRLDERNCPAGALLTTYKDTIDVAGFPTRCGCETYHRNPAQSARIVRLLEAKEFWTIGKAMTPEFSVGNNYDCLNPLFPNFCPSGSSTGSAAALAAGLCDFAVGTEAAGSSRWPAGNCGVVGLKLSALPALRDGLVPVSHTLDTIGFLARSLEDLDFVWRSRALDSVAPQSPAKRGPGYRIGVVRNALQANLHPEVRRHFESVIDGIDTPGLLLEDVSLDWWQYRGDTWKIIAYELYRIHEEFRETQQISYLPGTKAAIQSGAEISQNEYDELLRRNTVAQMEAEQFFRDAELDALILPLDSDLPRSKHAAPPDCTIASDDGADSLDSLSFTSLASVTGLPAIAFPSRLAESGCPIALQLYGYRGGERRLIEVASKIDRTLDRWPPGQALASAQRALVKGESA